MIKTHTDENNEASQPWNKTNIQIKYLNIKY